MSADPFPLAIEAIKNGDRPKLAELLSSAPDVESLLSEKITGHQPSNHAIGRDATLLQLASIRPWKDQDLSPLLLEHGASLDIHSAAGQGNVQRIAELLKQDTAAVQQQVDTYFPVQYAITANRPESIRCLMQHGDDANRDLKKVAYFGWEDDVADQAYVPWKPLHMASLWGFNETRVDVARALIESGADINAICPVDGYRPLHLVAMAGRVAMIRFFLENGAEVDSRSERCAAINAGGGAEGPCGEVFAMTPLMVACGEGFQEATECLLEHGADVHAVNEKGQTALHFAARKFWDGQPYDEVIKALLGRGASVDAADHQGNKPSLPRA